MSPPRKKNDDDLPEYPGTLPKPEITREADFWRFHWLEDVGPESSLALEFGQTKEHGEGIYAELEVKYSPNGVENKGHIYGPVKVNLTGPQGRSVLIGVLEKTLGTALWRDGKSYSLRWRDMIELTYRQVVIEFREGNPTLNLMKDVEEIKEVQYLVDRLIPLNQTTVLYCDGGLGKSWLALFIAVLVALGIDWPPFKLTKQGCCPVLYLDWEVEEGEGRRRAGWIARGLGYGDEEAAYLLDNRLLYRRMERPIYEEVGRIRRDIARCKIGLVIIDSAVPASGGNPNDADVARAAMNAIRNLYPATRLVLAHISKADAKNNAENGRTSGVYGNAFWRNLGRMLWEMKVDRLGGKYVVGLLNTKVNVGKQQNEFGLTFYWDEALHAMIFGPANIRDNPELAKSVGLDVHILSLLAENTQMTLDDLRKETKKSEYLVKKACDNLIDLGEVKQTGGGRGKGNKNTYALNLPEAPPESDQESMEMS